MSHNKVYSLGKVPFSWENSPGICKVTGKEAPKGVGHEHEELKLPPPPCPTESPKVLGKDLQIPLPPCPFQPPLRSASKKGIEKEDPFLAAYMECTKNVTKGKFSKGRSMSMFSCKRSCGVRDDSLVRMAHLPTSPCELQRKEISRTRSVGRRIDG